MERRLTPGVRAWSLHLRNMNDAAELSVGTASATDTASWCFAMALIRLVLCTLHAEAVVRGGPRPAARRRGGEAVRGGVRRRGRRDVAHHQPHSSRHPSPFSLFFPLLPLSLLRGERRNGRAGGQWSSSRRPRRGGALVAAFPLRRWPSRGTWTSSQ
ncbi:Os07g0584750 [Oryza sativa Japonica Group]|uniref:Os07g0584750 protein n=1 Tax=Oryza sativa subsp. japonica TaxID=39947 RepID=A0A0P0X8I4_ORYSJ|nr:hypothetical protein EE612_040336 [Oryza sativa]BAT02373.1 Os07g0584750 [Oryza sativa Japonica Group]